MNGISTNISPKNHPNVGKYTIHGAYGIYTCTIFQFANCHSLPRGYRSIAQSSGVFGGPARVQDTMRGPQTLCLLVYNAMT